MAYKIDLHGSTLTDGISTNYGDRAVRVARITGLDTDNTGLSDAIDELVVGEGFYHHRFTTLPLSNIQVRKIGATVAMARLTYARRRTSIPTQPAEVVARFRSDHRVPKLWYRLPLDSDGNPAWTLDRPSGMINMGIDASNPASWLTARPWVWNVPVHKIYIPTLLSFNPIANVTFALEKINADAVSWGGYSFAPGTLRFDSLSVDWLEYQGTNWFEVLYAFTAMQSGWVEQFVKWNATSKVLETHEVPTLDTAIFNNSFPVH